jgi:hypothetical protein
MRVPGEKCQMIGGTLGTTRNELVWLVVLLGVIMLAALPIILKNNVQRGPKLTKTDG